MTTTPDQQVAADDITHLDFAPPCESKAGDGCSNDADWILTWRADLSACCPPIQLLCDEHFKILRRAVADNAVVVCHHGNRVGRIRDVLAHIEHL